MTSDVIYGISKKASENASREEMPFGPELKYVGALPTSNNHNFEEEIILGEDKVVTKEHNILDSDTNRYCYRERNYYTTTNLLDQYNYYIIECCEFDTSAHPDYDYRVNEKKLIIDMCDKKYDSCGGGGTLKRFRLYYRKADPAEDLGYKDILIATKELAVSYETRNGVQYCKEYYVWK